MTRPRLILLAGGRHREKTLAELQEARAATLAELLAIDREIAAARQASTPSPATAGWCCNWHASLHPNDGRRRLRRHSKRPCPACARRSS